ncbi:MAG: bifunctional phosphopantothenoylcysteine decarboxylase/phosphopantothenate--cysteine ligase CoaBC [Burkholderiaceae bacterium]|nr:bifunctional phosphopantothenoylcysteine decarboxylase/phosphopantothenate--cysteine ligase CoaBC [Burkholderiaceae bacterium]
MRLSNRHFVIGITGGIAAYKTCELIRRLQDEGATVQVVMTDAGTRFVSALTFQALSGRPVYTDAWASPAQSGPANAMPHIDLSREADAIVVAPASADFIAQLATGQTNGLLATLCLARENPLLIAPAMNRQMWQNPSTQRNIEQVQRDGITLLGPGSGAQACGEIGDGRMLEPQDLLAALIARFGPDSSAAAASSTPNIRGVLQDQHVLITAGPTFEPIDPVRGITNRSSGKMGFALAEAAALAGAKVTLVSGPVHLATPMGVTRRDVTTANEMFDAVTNCLDSQPIDIFIGVAAVADWRPKSSGAAKLKKESGLNLAHIEWVENPDILASVARRPNAPYCVGFAAESGGMEDLKTLLPAKRQRKQVPLLVGNIGANTFGADTNHVLLCNDAGLHPLPPSSKTDLARYLIAHIAKSRNPS